MATWQSLTHPIISPEISGLLPKSDWGHWVPSKPHLVKGRRIDYTLRKAPMREVLCPQCLQMAAVPARALSGLCPHCQSHLQMGDFVLKTGTRRTKVHTLGNVLIESSASLSRLNIICQDLTMKGTGDGQIQCQGRLCIYSKPKMTQALQAHALEVRPGAHPHFESGIHVVDAEIRGEVSGFIHAEGSIRLHKGAIFHGDCRALVLHIEPGAMHLGRFEQIY